MVATVRLRKWLRRFACENDYSDKRRLGRVAPR
jgi:hypothetical protein